MTSSNNSAPARALPDIARIDFARPFTWLARGWHDLWQQPGASLFYGVAMAVAGGFILLATARMPYLFTAAVSGFLLVAPLLATGLYDLSRSYGRGETASLYDSMCAWRRNTSPMIGFGMVSLLAGTLWQVMSVIIVAFFYRGGALEPMEMILTILRDPQHDLLFHLLYRRRWHLCVAGIRRQCRLHAHAVDCPASCLTPYPPASAPSAKIRYRWPCGPR